MSSVKSEQRAEKLALIKDQILSFKKSPLYKFRVENNYLPVVGEGNIFAKIMLIGEAPGKNEALTGQPFCGRSGKVLDELLKSAELSRGDIYITNIVNDRPPENRDPTEEEKDLYAPFLDRQIEIIKPKIIATLGRHSMVYIMNHFCLSDKLEPIGQAHGKLFDAIASYGPIKIVALYHPAVAIYNIHQKATLVKDFKILNKISKL